MSYVMLRALLLFGAIGWTVFLFKKKDWPTGHRIGMAVAAFALFGFIVAMTNEATQQESAERYQRQAEQSRIDRQQRERQAQTKKRLAEGQAMLDRKAEREKAWAEAEAKGREHLMGAVGRFLIFADNDHCDRCKAIGVESNRDYLMLSKQGNDAEKRAGPTAGDPYYNQFIDKYKAMAERTDSEYLCGEKR